MCPFCSRLPSLKNKTDSSLIHEFDHAYLVLGDHQYYPGYTVLVLKEHIGDLTNLSAEVQQSFLKDSMNAAKIIKKIFKPYKMNYAVLGNEVEHVHMHLIPRYEDELSSAENKHPWYYAAEFKNHVPDHEEANQIIKKIKKEF